VGWQYVNNWGGIAGLGSIRIGIDGLGLTFVMLTTYLIPISILST
jgi:NADH:ubiquinone oxidoreductase subunit 4 (subunit M)